jgi:hypothetical protein
MRYLSIIFSVYILSLFYSCGGGNSLDIQGDQEAILLAETMIRELGGKKNWIKLRSLYIRTLARDMASGKPYAFEEWINLDEPKFMNHRILDEVHYFQIVNRNDGWSVKNQNVLLMQPGSVTSYLNWFDNFFMRNIKLLAIGGEQVEVKVNGENAFNMFINEKFISGFQLNENNLPLRYVTPGANKNFNIISITEWGEYKGFKYPLTVTGENILSYYQTDYWDIGMLDAEASFNVSFDPYVIAKSFE